MDPAALSMNFASLISFSESPTQSCVVNVTCTLLYTLNHSGWWSIFSDIRATRVMKPNAWLKFLNLYSLQIASRPSTSVHPAAFKGLSSVSRCSAVNLVGFGKDCGELQWLVGYILNTGESKVPGCHLHVCHTVLKTGLFQPCWKCHPFSPLLVRERP